MSGYETLTAADGHSFACWIAPAEGPVKGGIVILQEIFGVTDQLKSLAAAYAASGFTVAIPALFDRRARGAVIPFDQPLRGRDLALSLTEDEVMPDIRATIARLAQDGMRVALMGFCWGGGLAVRAAQVTDAAAAVGFYGTGLERYLQDDLHAPVLMHFGTEDDHTPPDIRAAFAARFPEADIHLYPTGHAFANDARASFQPEAARLAHQRSLDFLSRALAQPV